MRVLCLSDIHSDFAAFDPGAMPDATLCCVAGDVTQYGHIRQRTHGKELHAAKLWLAALGARFPTFVIPGNHDVGVENADFEGLPGVTPILNRRVEFERLSLYGVSLSPTYIVPRMARMFDYMTVDRDEERAAFDFEPVDIVVSHSPPMGVLDRLAEKNAARPGPHIGSEALADYIARNEPKLVVCGHVHHDAGEARIGKTLVVNAAKRWVVVEVD
jgi:hypothetical protein